MVKSHKTVNNLIPGIVIGGEPGIQYLSAGMSLNVNIRGVEEEEKLLKLLNPELKRI